MRLRSVHMPCPGFLEDCYEDDTETHALGMGIAVGSKLFSRFSYKEMIGETMGKKQT